MEDNKPEDIFNTIYIFFVESKDFNGIPIHLILEKHFGQ